MGKFKPASWPLFTRGKIMKINPKVKKDEVEIDVDANEDGKDDVKIKLSGKAAAIIGTAIIIGLAIAALLGW